MILFVFVIAIKHSWELFIQENHIYFILISFIILIPIYFNFPFASLVKKNRAVLLGPKQETVLNGAQDDIKIAIGVGVF